MVAGVITWVTSRILGAYSVMFSYTPDIEDISGRIIADMSVT